MERCFYINFTPKRYDDHSLDWIYKRFEPYFSPRFAKHAHGFFQYRMPISADSPILPELFACLEKTGCEYTISESVYYSANELKKVAYFEMHVPFPLEMEGKNPQHYGTKYRGGCSACGYGKHLDGGLIVPHKFMRKKSIGALPPNYFASKKVRDLIGTEKLTGVTFGSAVLDCSRQIMPEEYSVVHFSHVLPSLHPSTRLRSMHSCELCGFNHVGLYSDLKYDRAAFDDAKDFNVTQEHMGMPMLPSVVVSARVREIFRREKVGWAAYTPIFFVEE